MQTLSIYTFVIVLLLNLIYLIISLSTMCTSLSVESRVNSYLLLFAIAQAWLYMAPVTAVQCEYLDLSVTFYEWFLHKHVTI